MELREYLNSMAVDEQRKYAERCGTSIGYLRKAISVGTSFDVQLVIALERESGGMVTREELRHDIDWAYLRAPHPKAEAA